MTETATDAAKLKRLRRASLSMGPSEKDFAIPQEGVLADRPSAIQISHDFMGTGSNSSGQLSGKADDAPHFDHAGFARMIEKTDKNMAREDAFARTDSLLTPTFAPIARSPSPTASNSKFEFRVNAAVHERHPWEKLVGYVESGSWEQLARLPRDTELYINWSKWCKKHYSTVEDYIKITVLRYPWVCDPRTGLHSALPWPEDYESPFPPKNLFKPNSFPYAVSYGIRHDVLWASAEEYLEEKVVKSVVRWELPLAPPMVVGVDEEDIARRSKSFSWLPNLRIRVEFPLMFSEQDFLTCKACPTSEEIATISPKAFPFFQCIYFANPPHRKSVRGVPHIQCFSRRILGKMQNQSGEWELVVEGDGKE
jgi:hypothetical protein